MRKLTQFERRSQYNPPIVAQLIPRVLVQLLTQYTWKAPRSWRVLEGIEQLEQGRTCRSQLGGLRQVKSSDSASRRSRTRRSGGRVYSLDRCLGKLWDPSNRCGLSLERRISAQSERSDQ